MGSQVGGATNYQGLQSGTTTGQLAETRNHQVMPCPGVWQAMRVVLSAAPGGAETRTFNFRKASGATSLSVPITGAAVSGQDVSNTVSVNAGDLVGMEQVTSAGPAGSTTTRWTIQFVSTNPKQFPLMWGSPGSQLGAGQTKYVPPMGNADYAAASIAPAAIDGLAAIPAPCDGVITAIYMHGDTNQAGPGTNTLVGTLWKNGGPTTLIATNASGTNASNASGSIAVAKGDLLSTELVNNGTNTPRVCVSYCFEPTTDGEFPAMFAAPASTQGASTTRYNCLGGGAALNATETLRQTSMQACTVKFLHFTTNPANTGTVTGMVRLTAGNTSLTQVATGVSLGTQPPQTVSDITHSFTVIDDDQVDFQSVTNGSSGTVNTTGSVCLYIAPAASGSSPRRMLMGVGV